MRLGDCDVRLPVSWHKSGRGGGRAEPARAPLNNLGLQKNSALFFRGWMVEARPSLITALSQIGAPRKPRIAVLGFRSAEWTVKFVIRSDIGAAPARGEGRTCS